MIGWTFQTELKITKICTCEESTNCSLSTGLWRPPPERFHSMSFEEFGFIILSFDIDWQTWPAVYVLVWHLKFYYGFITYFYSLTFTHCIVTYFHDCTLPVFCHSLTFQKLIHFIFLLTLPDSPNQGWAPPHGEGGVPRPVPRCGEGVVPRPAPPRKNDQNRGEVAGQNKGLYLNFLQKRKLMMEQYHNTEHEWTMPNPAYQ